MVHYVDRQHTPARWWLWTGEVSYSWVSWRHLWGSTIFGSRRFTKVIPICHQWDPSSRLSSAYTHIQRVTRVNIAISITLQGSSFPVRSHKVVLIVTNSYSFIEIKQFNRKNWLKLLKIKSMNTRMCWCLNNNRINYLWTIIIYNMAETLFKPIGCLASRVQLQ